MSMLRIVFVVSFGLFSTSAVFAAGGKNARHCEIKKNGKTIDVPKEEIPNRKACKAKGGKWVKDHDHDHAHGEGADHEHEED